MSPEGSLRVGLARGISPSRVGQGDPRVHEQGRGPRAQARRRQLPMLVSNTAGAPAWDPARAARRRPMLGPKHGGHTGMGFHARRLGGRRARLPNTAGAPAWDPAGAARRSQCSSRKPRAHRTGTSLATLDGAGTRLTNATYARDPARDAARADHAELLEPVVGDQLRMLRGSGRTRGDHDAIVPPELGDLVRDRSLLLVQGPVLAQIVPPAPRSLAELAHGAGRPARNARRARTA